MKDRIFIEEEVFYETIWGKLFLFFIPFIIGFSYVGLLYIMLNGIDNTFWIIGGAMVGYFFPPAGKESVIPIAIGALRGTLSPATYIFLVSGTIAFIDVINSYFLMWNFYIAKKIPVIGRWIDNFQDFGAQKMKEKEWIKKLAFFGVALFVIVPFQGSGGVGASILGRVIGMDKFQAWLAIISGSFFGCFLIGILSHYMGEAIIGAFESNIFAGIGMLIIVIVVFIFLYYIAKTRLFGDSKSISRGQKDEN